MRYFLRNRNQNQNQIKNRKNKNIQNENNQIEIETNNKNKNNLNNNNNNNNNNNENDFSDKIEEEKKINEIKVKLEKEEKLFPAFSVLFPIPSKINIDNNNNNSPSSFQPLYPRSRNNNLNNLNNLNNTQELIEISDEEDNNNNNHHLVTNGFEIRKFELKITKELFIKLLNILLKIIPSSSPYIIFYQLIQSIIISNDYEKFEELFPQIEGIILSKLQLKITGGLYSTSKNINENGSLFPSGSAFYPSLSM